MQIDGASVLVTGGASGLGAATAQRLAKRGARVTILDLGSSDGAETAARLGDGVGFVPGDVTEPADVEAAVAAATAQGPLRGLVHCAGRGGDRLRIIDSAGLPADFDSFKEVVRVNLFGTYNVLRITAASMRPNELLDGDRGAIVLTASVAAFDGQIGQTSYTASKAAVHGITLVAARDLASHQIRVNTIAPGTFDTPMLARLRDDIRAGLARSVPHPKRLGAADDYAHMALALLENSYVNGETIRLDGAIRMAPR
jgi:NAD(P)-dependent dehydrogenase (short-subunit alcohol dehydrogenase family)